MLYSEIIAVCSEIHTKNINTLCGQDKELLNVKLVVRIVTTGLKGVNVAVMCVVCSWWETGMLWRLWSTTLLWRPTQSALWWPCVQSCSSLARTTWLLFCSGTKTETCGSTDFCSRDQNILASGIPRVIRTVRLNFLLQQHGSPVRFWPVKYSKWKVERITTTLIATADWQTKRKKVPALVTARTK